MTIIYEDRLSDNPFVETIWRAQVVRDGGGIVSSDICWDMLIINQEGSTRVSIWGPMTRSAYIPHTEGQEWLAIRFKAGTFIPHLSVDKMVNQGITLPEASAKSFWLDSSTWECPNYGNVETFVNRLVRGDILFRDAVVESALQGYPQANSFRTIQRRFMRVMGLTQRTVRSIERARQAYSLLQSGLPILAVVHQAGYADQQTMTKSLKHYLGYTPGQIARIRNNE